MSFPRIVGNWYQVIGLGVDTVAINTMSFGYPINLQSAYALYALAINKTIYGRYVPQSVKDAAIEEWRRRFPDQRETMIEEWQVKMNEIVWPPEEQ